LLFKEARQSANKFAFITKDINVFDFTRAVERRKKNTRWCREARVRWMDGSYGRKRGELMGRKVGEEGTYGTFGVGPKCLMMR
jgi:hypothetical protein